MSVFSFSSVSSANKLNSMPGFDFAALSPTMTNADMFMCNEDSSRPMHVNPAAMWNGSGKNDHAHLSASIDFEASQNSPSSTKLFTDYDCPSSRLYGQITPPDDTNSGRVGDPPSKYADSAVSNGADVRYLVDGSSPSASASQVHPSKRRSKKARRDSRISDDDDDDDDHAVDGDNKREKYREKNRVAAAKCRAKKKEHVDHLEENHRRQSMLNTALKQTEKSLRDELSFWRTQALQHTFCNCRPIQDYNLRKARNLAAESTLGNPITTRSPSMKSHSSRSALSPPTQPCDMHPGRSQSMAGLGVISPSMVLTNPECRPKSIAAPSTAGYGSHQSLGPVHTIKPSGSAAVAGPLSSATEQELESFVNDATD